MSGFAPVRPPRPPSARSAARPPSGAPKPPPRPKAAKVNTDVVPEPYPLQGIDWRTKPQTEWTVAWVLMTKLGAKLGEDFLYQQIIPAPGVNISGKGYRSDFWILPRGKLGGIGPPYTRGILIDPISLYTHPNTGEDRYRRGVLAQKGWLLVWIDDTALYLTPVRLVRDAIRGIDHSSVARSAR